MVCIISTAFSVPIPHSEPAPFDLSHYSGADGSYKYTFASENESKTETRTPDGQVRGAYSYVDSNGVVQKVQYVADENGYQVYGTNLPVGSTVPVKETPEVLEATAQHFALIDRHLKKIEIAKRMEEEYRAKHPERFAAQQAIYHEEPAPEVPVEEVVIRHEVPPKPEAVVVRHEVAPPKPEVVVPLHHVVVHFTKHEEAAPVVQHEVPVVHFEKPHEEVEVPHSLVSSFVPPEDPEDVKIAKAHHLAEVARLTKEHLEAFAAVKQRLARKYQQ